jgi:hypothetical protein
LILAAFPYILLGIGSMSQRAEFQEPAYPPAAMPKREGAKIGLWEKIKFVASRAVLWSYERGSWQYDIIVVLILAFIFLTPASWFHDRPQLQLTDVRHLPGIVELSHAKNTWTLQIDARLVPSSAGPAAEQSIRELLRPRFGGHFTILSVAPIRDGRGVMLGYNVVVSAP